MNGRFLPVEYSQIEEAVRAHYASLPSPTDSFLEEHILTSSHYRIEIAGQEAGIASIHAGKLITQFALHEAFRDRGQEVFTHVRRLEQVQSAFVPTCDEFFLSHALDDYRQLAKQAYFFAVSSTSPPARQGEYALRLATPGDADLVTREAGGFFTDIAGHIARQELFLTLYREHLVGFGLLLKSALYDHVASIGMYTIERYRRTGVGTATISLLIQECHSRRLRPVAGCWYYNHRSKQTLERAGMYSQTRLLKIDYRRMDGGRPGQK